MITYSYNILLDYNTMAYIFIEITILHPIIKYYIYYSILYNVICFVIFHYDILHYLILHYIGWHFL